MERQEEKHTNRASAPDPIDEAMELAIRAEQRRERLMIGAWVGATVVALVATVTLLESCGSSGGSGTGTASYPETEASAPVAVAASTDGAVTASTPQEGVPFVQDGSEGVSPSAPPDVVVSASDTAVTAGQAIEVTVEATPDVTEMALSDGFGDAIPMVRDSSGLTWRANYRVPLRPRSERLGLSVTAKNEHGRWRRVWHFLEVGSGGRRPSQVLPPSEDGGMR